MSDNTYLADLFMERLPADIRAGLNADQVNAIRSTVLAVQPREHAVDFRFNVGLPRVGRYYGVLLGGTDRRDAARHKLDQQLRRRRLPDRTLTAALVCVLGLAVMWMMGVLSMV